MIMVRLRNKKKITGVFWTLASETLGVHTNFQGSKNNNLTSSCWQLLAHQAKLMQGVTEKLSSESEMFLWLKYWSETTKVVQNALYLLKSLWVLGTLMIGKLRVLTHFWGYLKRGPSLFRTLDYMICWIISPCNGGHIVIHACLHSQIWSHLKWLT